MANLPYNPLTQEHCDTCTDVLRKSAEVRAVLDACQRIGLPCDEWINRLNSVDQIAAGIKREFFPHQP